jgi:signal transduction histidine kinase
MSLDAALSEPHRSHATAPESSLDGRMVALMRMLLALSGLLIIWIEPSEPARLVVLTYGSLAAYFFYSLALLAALLAGYVLVPERTQPWIDVLVYAYLIGLTEGTSSIFFHFFFFAILVASFTRGFAEGFAVTIASAVLFVSVGFGTAAGSPAFELDRALIRPVYLFLLGYMIAFWGGSEISLRRRLHLLKDVAHLANPRLGVDHAVTQSLRRVMTYFRGEACVLVRAGAGAAPFSMYRVEASGVQNGRAPQMLNADAAGTLLGLPQDLALLWGPRRPSPDPAVAERCQRLANLLECLYFVSVPFREAEGTPGRVFLTHSERPFSNADIEFLGQVVDLIAASVSHLTLLEELMLNASQLERSRISRDIHDTTIQPYIGLKLGLEALHRKLEAGSPAAAPLKELIDRSAMVINDLRGYVTRLRGDTPGWPGDQLLAGLRDQIGRYQSFYGIRVELRGPAEPRIPDRIATEAYQIVCEGLSNVVRHSAARSAYVELRASDSSLLIEIGNDRAGGGASIPFAPRSISERAAALGGFVQVLLDSEGHDVVRVKIPA